MSCFRPNIILQDTSKEPAENVKFISGNKKGSELDYEFYNKKNDFYKKYGIKLQYIQVPCGQCEACQERTSKQWAIRCVLQANLSKHNYFLTLTYDDEHLNVPEYLVDKDGVLYEDDGTWELQGGCLEPSDMKGFLTRLNRHYNYRGHQGLKYYYCGEYGDISGRAHFHAIIFNMPIKEKDLKVYRINTDGSVYYTCDWITKLWGKGYVVIGEVNWDTCAYTARYVMKKQKALPPEEYYKRGKIPEFVQMSRRPGIAKEAYKETYFENDEIIIKGHRERIQSAKPPRYFDKIYDLDHHEQMQKIKEIRKELAEAAQREEMSRTSLTIREHLRMKQRQKKDVWQSLKRNKV